MAREKKTVEKLTVEKKINPIFEIILVAVTTIGWIVWQVLLILQVDTDILAKSEYIVKSFVNSGTSVLMSDNVIELGYLYVLRGIFYVFGNHAVAVLWLQFALQLVGAFVLYRGMRKLLGRIVAILVYLAALFLPYFLLPMAEVQPMWLVFLAGTLLIYFLGTIINVLKNKKNTSTQAVDSEPVKTQPEEAEVMPIQEDKPKVKLLDNPLPGPKKHVSKVLDYDLKLERMPRVFLRYDIKVSDDDDFDLQ